MRNRGIGIVTAGVIGLGIGVWWSPRGERGTGLTTTVAMTPPATSITPATRPSKNPAKPTVSSTDERSPASRSPLDGARTLARLSQEGVMHMWLPVVEQRQGGDVQLSSTLRKLLDVTPAEEERITSAIQHAKARVSEIESELARMECGAPDTEEAGAMIITVPAFAERGGKLYDELYSAVAATLGPERIALFDQLTGDALEQAAGRLGAQERRIVIKRKPGEADGTPTYVWADAYKQGDGGGSTNSESGREYLNQHFGELAKRLLPPDF